MSLTKPLVNWVKRQNPKFRFLHKSFGRKPFNMLDIGSGNHSASKTVALFPACSYYGVDLDKNYNNDERDFQVMKDFYIMDLTLLEFDNIPDQFFDAIWLVHVIEHLPNGEEVMEGLIKKLAPGGYLYVEYPGKKSTTLPSMYGTLNYYDDPTHVRLYDVKQLKQRFQELGLVVNSSGVRRSWFYVIMVPFRVCFRWMRGKKVSGNIFWDLLGFAEYLWVKKIG